MKIFILCLINIQFFTFRIEIYNYFLFIWYLFYCILINSVIGVPNIIAKSEATISTDILHIKCAFPKDLNPY